MQFGEGRKDFEEFIEIKNKRKIKSDLKTNLRTKMSEEWCIEQLAKLQIKERRLATLNEIKTHLTNVRENEVINSASSFLALLDSIEDCHDSPEQMNLTCDILCMCMSNLEINHNDKVSYCSYLERCLLHKNDDVKMLGLNDIERRIKDSDGNNVPSHLNSLYQSNMVIALLNCFECEDSRIAIATVSILLKLLPFTIEDKAIKGHIEQILGEKDVIRCRVYDLAVKATRISIENHEKFEFILEKLIADLDTEDILLKLNILDFTSDLAQTDHGHTYMENKGVFVKVLRQIEELEDNPLKSILVPGYLKFFGHIAAVQPAKIIQGFPGMINSLFDCIMDGNASTLPVAFDTLGQLGRSNEGKILLNNLHSKRMFETVSDIGKSVHNLPTPLQSRALNSLETLFQPDSSDAPNNEISSIMECWFIALCGHKHFVQDLGFIHEFCRNPFPEIKIAALCLLRVVCMYRWGQRALSETAGFIEYLLDRKAEFHKDVLHEKFIVLSTLLDSSDFDINTLNQIKQYVQEGIFHVSGVMEVAVEGS